MLPALLGTALSGLALWDKRLQPHIAWLFPPENIGVIHIGLSISVVVIFTIYIAYLNYKNWLNHISLRLRELVVAGRVRWKDVAALFYWGLFLAIAIETVSGILLTKLIDKPTLAKIFSIETEPLTFIHLHLTWFVLIFPAVHITAHWFDGRCRKIASIFQPRIFPRRPGLVDAMIKLKEENARLRGKANAART